MQSGRMSRSVYFLPFLLAVLTSISFAQATFSGVSCAPEFRSKMDEIAQKTLSSTGVPSASVAVVKGNAVCVRAYGDARIQPRLAATPSMQYSIGSISKQFTATAILMLAEEGKLSVDDPVGKYIPDLTRGNEVTIRELLSHTSGYQDYWPQDYVPPLMLKDITPQGILDRWARKPLDFEPGTKWQYSNTNFVIAGLIVQKVAGMPLLDFLTEHVFKPLNMQSVTNTDQAKLPPNDPEGYFRYALGPARPAPKEGKGWMFAAGELAMTPADLAKWNISLIRESLMKPDSYRELETEVRLKNGVGTQYGLGISVDEYKGHRELSHSGEVSGFTADNIVLPDDNMAVTVLTNQDAARAASDIAHKILDVLLETEAPQGGNADELVRKAFEGLKEGKIDRALFTENANAYFTAEAVQDYKNTLQPLGTPESFEQTATESRGGMIFRLYTLKYPQKTLQISIYQMPDKKFEQFIIRAKE